PGRLHDRAHLYTVERAVRVRRHRVLLLYRRRLLAFRRGRRARHHCRRRDRRHAVDRWAGFGDRHLSRHPDPGPHSNLHHVRRHAFELVDQDRNRRTAVCLHRLAADDDRTRAQAGGEPRRSKAMTSHIVVIPTRRAHSNHAEVARSIGVDIIAGRYAEGTRLPGDAELTATFGVSRPVLRESVKTLVAKGLLTTKARVGTVVRERGAWNMFDADVLAWHLDAGIDKRFLNDLAEIRLAVEPRAAALAAARCSEEDIAELRRSMDRMRHEDSDSVGFAD